MTTKDEVTTTDLAQFGNREKAMAGDLLKAMADKGLPKDFYDDEVTVMMNRNSGNVFLTNSNYEVAMMNGDDLESFYSCPQCGCEGFYEDIGLDNHTGTDKGECRRWIKDVKAGR